MAAACGFPFWTLPAGCLPLIAGLLATVLAAPLQKETLLVLRSLKLLQCFCFPSIWLEDSHDLRTPNYVSRSSLPSREWRPEFAEQAGGSNGR